MRTHAHCRRHFRVLPPGLEACAPIQGPGAPAHPRTLPECPICGHVVPPVPEVHMHRKIAAAVFALALLAGCEQAPAVTEPESVAPAMARGGQGAAKRAAPLTNLP